jgi:MFS family permease
VTLLLICAQSFPGQIRLWMTETSGFFFSAPISDCWGRKVAIMVGCSIVIIAIFVSTFSPRNMGGLIARRTIVRLGQGIALPAGPTYIISEIAPAESRGKIMSFW